MKVDIMYIDIDKRGTEQWPLEDFNTDSIPRKGDIIQLNHYVGNINNLYYGEVLFVIDKRQLWGNTDIRECEMHTRSITVVTREIKGEWGEETYNTILNAITKI